MREDRDALGVRWPGLAAGLAATFGVLATAIGIAANWTKISETYDLLPHGGSVGRGYGPVVVARSPDAPLRVILRRPGVLSDSARVTRPAFSCTEIPMMSPDMSCSA